MARTVPLLLFFALPPRPQGLRRFQDCTLFPESRSLPATGNSPAVRRRGSRSYCLPYFSGWRSVPGRFRLQNESLFSCFPSVSPPAGSHSSWFFPRTGFLWIPQSGVRSYRHISSIRLSGWNYPPLQALSNARTDALSDRSADWTEAPSDSTRSFSYALFSDGTPPRFFLSRSRTGTASNGGGFFLPVLSPGRRSGVHTGAPSDLLSHTPPPRLT